MILCSFILRNSEFVIVLHDKPSFRFIERSGLRLIKPQYPTRDLQRNLPVERKRPRPGPLCTGGYYGGSHPTGHNRGAVSSLGTGGWKALGSSGLPGADPTPVSDPPRVGEAWTQPSGAQHRPRPAVAAASREQGSPCHSWLPATPPCSRQPLYYCSCFCWDVSGLEILFWTWLFIPCIKSMRYRKLSLEVHRRAWEAIWAAGSWPWVAVLKCWWEIADLCRMHSHSPARGEPRGLEGSATVHPWTVHHNPEQSAWPGSKCAFFFN